VAEEIGNPDVNDSTQFYYNQAVVLPPIPTINQTFTGDTTTVVTTINGNGGGQATGPAITLSGGSTGYDFTATAGTVTLAVDNAATARTAISAAKSGANSDLTSFSTLTGNTGYGVWSGTADKTTHATYPTTVASVAYVQAEMQGLMDKMKQITESFKAVEDALFAWGGLET
jgi:hypothetical protein